MSDHSDREAYTASLEELLREALRYKADAFTFGLEVNGADLVDWFAEWRGRVYDTVTPEMGPVVGLRVRPDGTRIFFLPDGSTYWHYSVEAGGAFLLQMFPDAVHGVHTVEVGPQTDELVGRRVRFEKAYDSYPERLQIQPGDTGLVTKIDDEGSVWVALDRYHPGLDEWDNQVQLWDWRDQDAEACDPRSYVIPLAA